VPQAVLGPAPPGDQAGVHCPGWLQRTARQRVLEPSCVTAADAENVSEGAGKAEAS